MEITLGTFTKSEAGFIATLKTLNAAAAPAIVPVDKTSDNGPDYRVYAGQRHYEIGAGWSQVAKSSGEIYVNLKLACPSSARSGCAGPDVPPPNLHSIREDFVEAGNGSLPPKS